MPKAVVIAADAAADMFYQGWADEFLIGHLWKDVHRIRQPYEHLFLEWRLPTETNCRVGVLGTDHPNQTGDGGYLHLLISHAKDAQE